MEQVKVDESREEPPEWARPVPAGDTVITDRQKSFITALVGCKDLGKLSEKQRAFCQQWLEEGSITMTKKKASDVIDTLVKLPDKPRESKQSIGLPDVPAGRYAIEANDGELRFYKVWVGRNGFVKLYVLHGPDETQMNFKTAKAIMEKILAAGVRPCAIRYGMEIGACSNCGKRLTNRISRELGIGPVCGGRMFGDDFKEEVKVKRSEIQARGEDPNEEFGD